MQACVGLEIASLTHTVNIYGTIIPTVTIFTYETHTKKVRCVAKEMSKLTRSDTNSNIELSEQV